MNLVPNVVGRSLARNSLLLQKNSPQILLGVGVVGVVASTVLACRSTLKLEEVLQKHANDLNNARAMEDPSYSEKDRASDIRMIKRRAAVDVAKLYGPAVIAGGIGIVALTKGHLILSRRNAALSAAYVALDKGFTEYRARVVDKYGEDADRDFRHGTRQVDVYDEKTKKNKRVTRTSMDTPSIYARFFDQTSSAWKPDPEHNLYYIRCQQNFWNDRLRQKGHVFLNEVYESLGMEDTKPGQVVGWVYSKEGNRDNFIDFGVFNGNTQQARDFVNGFNDSILLDFNVDGPILDLLDD